MKKFFILLLSFTVLFPLVSEKALVEEVSGKVEVKLDNKWVPVQVGQEFDTGVMISTGFKSSAKLKIAGAKITLQPLTRMAISEITNTEDTDGSEVFLDAGTIVADVKPLENKRARFTVRSPAATASVRGTSGEVTSDGKITGYTGVWYTTDNSGNNPANLNSGKTVYYSPGESSTLIFNATVNDLVITTGSSLSEKDGGGLAVTSNGEGTGYTSLDVYIKNPGLDQGNSAWTSADVNVNLPVIDNDSNFPENGNQP